MQKEVLTEDRPVVAIFGANTRLGQALCRELKNVAAELLCYTIESLEAEPEKTAYMAIQVKKPPFIINCLVDPDDGNPPRGQKFIGCVSYVTQVLVQQAMRLGLRYIHVSSSRVYGWCDDLRCDDPEGYGAYAPACAGDDRWAQVALALERIVLDQTHRCRPAVWSKGSPDAGYLLLRFGHMLHTYAIDPVPRIECTLDRAIELALDREQTFIVPSPDTTVSVLTTKMAARCISHAITQPGPLSCGSYNIGSPPVSLTQLFGYLLLKSGQVVNLTTPQDVAKLKDWERGDGKLRAISGVATHTGLNSNEWSRRSGFSPGKWQTAIEEKVRSYRPAASWRSDST